MEGSMLRKIRVEAGLGDPPGEFTTKSCESMNSTLRAAVNHKKSDVPKRCRILLMNNKKRWSVQLSVVGSMHFNKSSNIWKSRWFQMSSEQCSRHLQKVASTCLHNSQGSLCGTATSNVRADGDALMCRTW